MSTQQASTSTGSSRYPQGTIPLLSRAQRWVWILVLLAWVSTYGLLSVFKVSSEVLTVWFYVGVFWVASPIAMLLYNQAHRDTEPDLTFTEELESQLEPTTKEVEDFLVLAKASSSLTLTPATAEDLCAICLDELDCLSTVCTLRCGHVFHEECVDSFVGQLFKRAYGLCANEKILWKLSCPVCRARIESSTSLSEDKQNTIDMGNVV